MKHSFGLFLATIDWVKVILVLDLTSTVMRHQTGAHLCCWRLLQKKCNYLKMNVPSCMVQPIQEVCASVFEE